MIIPPMRWLAARFPFLPLEVHAPACASAVLVGGRVWLADEVAAACGVAAGMRLATARGRCPELLLIERDEARELSALHRLACRLGEWTPRVCPELSCASDELEPPALLLDIAASIRLFGGARAIGEAVRAACLVQGHAVQLAIAPTPRAALWLARGQQEGRERPGGPEGIPCVATLEALPSAIAHLPVSALNLPPSAADSLSRFGLRTLADLAALPRSGLVRRLGAEFLTAWAQGLGEMPDPRDVFAPPETFFLARELSGTCVDAGQLLPVAMQLVDAFCGWLGLRQAGASRLRLELQPERSGLASLALDIALGSPSRDPARWQRSLAERLPRVAVSDPVGSLGLRSCGIEPLPGQSADWLAGPASTVPLEELVEMLRARLGEAAVHGVQAVPDHRPECATRASAVGESVVRSAHHFANRHRSGMLKEPSFNHWSGGRRPLWLLPQAEPLLEDGLGGKGLRRRGGGSLRLVSGPERIESGWWDKDEAPSSVGDVRRDYFWASDASGALFWLYRDQAGWWMQGLGG